MLIYFNFYFHFSRKAIVGSSIFNVDTHAAFIAPVRDENCHPLTYASPGMIRTHR